MGLEPNPFLVASSLGFIVPITLNVLYHQWALYSINVAMMLASTMYHATKWPPLFYLDASLGYALTFVHFYYSIQMGQPFLTAPGITYCIIMFWYGYRHRCFVWDPSLNRATLWHLSMHAAVLASVISVALVD